jgi:hypothetical protein
VIVFYFAGVELAAGVLDDKLAALLDEEESDEPLDLLAAVLSPELLPDLPLSPEPLPSLDPLLDEPPSDELLFAVLLEP